MQADHPIIPRPTQGTNRMPVVAALLDSIRSAYNVGAMFRTADGAGLCHLFLCGTTATPMQDKVRKTALGAESSVGWSYHPNSIDLADKIISDKITLIGLELAAGADSIFNFGSEFLNKPVVLAVGNEITGLDPALRQRCHRLVYLPMLGTKESLNVATAFGVAAYVFRFYFACQPDG